MKIKINAPIYIENNISHKDQIYYLAGSLVTLVLMFALSKFSFLLFHGITEMVSIFVAWSVFILVWNTRRIVRNDALLFLGIAYLFIGLMDLIHTLSYKGMGIFPNFPGANYATQLWIAARVMEAVSLLLFPLLITRHIRTRLVMGLYAVITAFFIASIFLWNVFPDCYIDGQGLTAFKKVAEYIISFTLLTAIFLLYQIRQQLDTPVFRLMVGAIAITIAGELAFTFYVSVFGLSNVIGHFFKIISFSLVYLALIRSSLIKPYTTLFQELEKERVALKEGENRFRRAIEEGPFPIMIHAEDGEVLSLSRAWTELSGYSHDDIPTIDIWTEKAYGMQKEMVIEDINNLYDLKHRKEEGEYEITCLDGQKRIWEFSSVALGRLPDNRRIAMSMAGDVTHLKNEILVREKAEKTLRESESFLNETGAIAKIGGWNIEIETQTLTWTKEVFNLHEVTDDYQPTVETAVNFYDSDSKHIIRKAVEEAMQFRKPFDLELGLITAKNNHIDVRLLGNIQQDINGKAKAIKGTFQDITEHKKAEKEILSISKFSSENPNPVMRISKEGSLLYNNEATVPLLETWGYDGNKGISDEWKQICLDVFNLGIKKEIEVLCAERTFTFNFVPIVDLGYINVYGLDITDLKREEIRYKTLFNSMDEAFARHEIILDEKGKPIDYRFLTINPAFEKMLGISATQVIGKTVLELFPETESIWIEKYGEVALTGKSIKFEDYSAGPDKYFNVSAHSPQHGQFAVIFSDVTEIKQMELQLEKEMNFLAITLSSIGDGVIATDDKGKVIFLNPISEQLTGWSNAEASGKKLLDVFDIRHEETKEICEDPAQRVIETGQMIELANHTCLHSKDGTVYVIEDSASPIKDNNNEMVGVIIVFRDETEKKKLRENINNNQKLESLGVLAGGIAHDFNNYLSGIFGYIELAMAETENLPSHSNSNQYLQEAINIFQNAKSLTQQLLTFAKGGAPKKTLANISIVFERSINFALSGSNIIPKLTIDDDLWPSVCDENRIGQCFDNLIINAMQSMPKGGEIIFTAKNCFLKSKNYLKIIIQDSGCGITQDKLQKIFDPFFTTKETGHGLGLATVYSIIKNHDGWIDVESKVDVGTTFTIYLPAVKEDLPVDKGEKSSNIQGNSTILVMDDQPYILELYKVMLDKLGYTVIAVENGTFALEQIKLSLKGDQKISACFLDLTLPGSLSGIDVAKEIKEISPEIINIASSGYSDSPVFSNPEEYGFNDSLEKPFSSQDLIRVLGKHL